MDKTIQDVHAELVEFQTAMRFLAKAADTLSEELHGEGFEVTRGLGLTVSSLGDHIKRITDDLEPHIVYKWEEKDHE